MLAALSGYSLQAVSNVFDKFLLSERRIGAPPLYAFFTALTSLPFLALLPFGVVLFSPRAMAFGVFSGFLFLFGLLAMYRAIKRSEVSRAAPLIGVATVVFLFLLSILFSIASGRTPDPIDVFALGLLAGGGILLSTGGIGIRGPGFTRCVFVSGALYAASLVMLREAYAESNFITGLVWSKAGMFLAGLALLSVGSSRRAIAAGGRRLSGSGKRTAGTTVFFFLNQAFGGAGTFLVAYAVSLGPATFVQGVGGVQYALVFVLATLLSIRFPDIFREHISAWGMFRKIAAIALLSLGVWLVASSGALRGFI